MRYRATFAAGLAAGFVIGARAGRERYEQMKKLARRAADNPAVQQAAGAAAAKAAGLTKKVQQRTPGVAGAAMRKAGERLPGRLSRWQGDSGQEAANGGQPAPAPDSATDV